MDIHYPFFRPVDILTLLLLLTYSVHAFSTAKIDHTCLFPLIADCALSRLSTLAGSDVGEGVKLR
jgi:hypothetical protein